jgi:hypothetical protein
MAKLAFLLFLAAGALAEGLKPSEPPLLIDASQPTTIR